MPSLVRLQSKWRSSWQRRSTQQIIALSRGSSCAVTDIADENSSVSASKMRVRGVIRYLSAIKVRDNSIRQFLSNAGFCHCLEEILGADAQASRCRRLPELPRAILKDLSIGVPTLLPRTLPVMPPYTLPVAASKAAIGNKYTKREIKQEL